MTPMKRRRRTFFLIIGLTLAFIGLAAGLNRVLAPAPWTPNPDATATAVVFFATVEAGDSAGLPTPAAHNRTWDGLQIDIERVDFDAWPVVKLENQFNDEPGDGNRMILLTLNITNVAGELGEAIRVSDSDFSLIDGDLNEYTTYDERTRCGVIPNDLSAQLKPGESVTGNVCMQAPIATRHLTLEYESSVYGLSPSYFALPE